MGPGHKGPIHSLPPCLGEFLLSQGVGRSLGSCGRVPFGRGKGGFERYLSKVVKEMDGWVWMGMDEMGMG